MKGLPVIRRGFGGSTFDDLLMYTHRIVIPYAPRIIVVYEGDNDLAPQGTRPERVRDDFKTFADTVHAALPGTTVYFLSIKPGGSRFARWPDMKKANELIRDFARTRKNLGYIDISPSLLGPDGRPDDALFVKDRLHLNREGYARWAAVIKPVLEKRYRQ